MELHDNSPMPYGKNKGKTMANVPAPYLLALYNKNLFDCKGGPEVKRYIEANIKGLQQEAAAIKRR